MQKEENPFETEEGARLWIQSIENEKGLIRDKYFYPLLKEWVSQDSIQTVLDIGGGQGVASQFCIEKQYTNVEPSEYLVARAKEIYSKYGNHVVGNVYDLPFPNKSFDAAFSITVWFHLQDLTTAAREVSRVLKENGKFLIINPNPRAYDVWRTLYSDIEDIDQKSFVGKASVPHSILPRNTFYKHTQEEIVDSLQKAGLKVDEIKEFAPLSARFSDTKEDIDFFIYFKGHKN